MKHFFLPIIFMLLVFLPGIAYAVAAFPGAEGFGANSAGGRGGAIIKVTNLNNSGPGSFRAAVEAPGKRIVVFEVSGIINLTSNLYISNPYITIAGQTSPGGILVTGRPTIINTHDLIMQHMRFRLGSHGVIDQNDAETFDTIAIYGDYGGYYPNKAYNIIIDHSSFSWGIDETFSSSWNATNITLQWSIVSEGLNNAKPIGHPKADHSKGLLISGKNNNAEVSIHHNYLAHNQDRNPMIGGGVSAPLADVVNNVVYNFKGNLSMMTYEHGRVNWVHNYVKRGPRSNATAFEAIHYPQGLAPHPLIYVKGNIGIRRMDQSAPEWSVGFEWQNQLLNEGFRKIDAWPAAAITTDIMSPAIANCLLSAVGATAPVRDSVDSRIIADFSAGTGAIIDTVTYPGDFPTFTTPAPPADTDNDGMADSWEVLKGLNTKANDSAMDRNNDGYTNIEEYLHHLSVSSYTFDGDCMPMPVAHIKIKSVK